MKALKIAAAVCLVLLTAFLFIGLLAPTHYQGEMTREYRKTPQEVWQLLTDYPGLADRRSEITQVEMLGRNTAGNLHWKEYTDYGGFLEFEQLDSIPHQRLSVRMVENMFPMTGTWTYELKPKAGGTLVTIYEESSIEPIIMRIMMYLSGRGSILRQEHKYLKAALR